MNKEKSLKTEEDIRLEQIMKQQEFDAEKTRKLLEHQGGGIIPSEWENLMGMFGDREEPK